MHISLCLPMQQLLHVKCSSSMYLLLCSFIDIFSPRTDQLQQFLVLVCQQDHMPIRIIAILPYWIALAISVGEDRKFRAHEQASR